MPSPSATARRLFIAIDVPAAVAWRLARPLVDPPRGVRPVPTGQVHLTLHFLGDVEDGIRAAVSAALTSVRQEPFTITIRGCGVFPPRGRPTVLWAGVADSAPLAALHAAVGAAVMSCGLAVESRPYVPHVTLARLTPAVPRAWLGRARDGLAALGSEPLPVDRFHLYRSCRRDGTTVHEIEATFPLMPPTAGQA